MCLCIIPETRMSLWMFHDSARHFINSYDQSHFSCEWWASMVFAGCEHVQLKLSFEASLIMHFVDLFCVLQTSPCKHGQQSIHIVTVAVVHWQGPFLCCHGS